MKMMSKIDLDNLNIKDFKPLWDNIIVRPIKIEKKGDFIRPQGEEDRAELGEVVSSPVEDLKKGDIVLFNKYSIVGIDMGREFVIRSEDIIAVYNK